MRVGNRKRRTSNRPTAERYAYKPKRMKRTNPTPKIHENVRNTVPRAGRRKRRRRGVSACGGTCGGISVMSLRHDCEIPAAAFSVAAERMEDRSIAARA